LGNGHELFERLSVTHGQISQQFTVEHHLGPFQAGNETGIRHSLGPASRIDADRPETPELTLFQAAVGGRKSKRPLDRLTGGTIELSPAAKETFRAPKPFLPPSPRSRDIRNSGHDNLSE
jgi:hypothetical protein